MNREEVIGQTTWVAKMQTSIACKYRLYEHRMISNDVNSLHSFVSFTKETAANRASVIRARGFDHVGFEIIGPLGCGSRDISRNFVQNFNEWIGRSWAWVAGLER